MLEHDNTLWIASWLRWQPGHHKAIRRNRLVMLLILACV